MSTVFYVEKNQCWTLPSGTFENVDGVECLTCIGRVLLPIRDVTFASISLIGPMIDTIKDAHSYEWEDEHFNRDAEIDSIFKEEMDKFVAQNGQFSEREFVSFANDVCKRHDI